jgi:hypothetical protein
MTEERVSEVKTFFRTNVCHAVNTYYIQCSMDGVGKVGVSGAVRDSASLGKSQVRSGVAVTFLCAGCGQAILGPWSDGRSEWKVE